MALALAERHLKWAPIPAALFVLACLSSCAKVELADQSAALIDLKLGVPAQLAFVTQPSGSATAAVVFSRQPVVEIEDYKGNRVSSAVDTITLSAYTDATCTTVATGGALSSSPLSAAAGLASFSGVSYTAPETIYLKASSGNGYESACSEAVTVNPGSGSQLNFFAQPSTTATAGTVFSAQPEVELLDSLGNRDTSFARDIQLDAYTDSGCTTPAVGTLSAATNPLTATSGLSSFASLKYSRAETIYLCASVVGDASIPLKASGAITVSPASGQKLVFTTEPSSRGSVGASSRGSVGAALTTQPVVKVEDNLNNVVSTATNTVTLTAYSDSSCSSAIAGATLSGGTVAASGGVATFTNLSGTKGGYFYLGASSAGLVSACSTTPIYLSESPIGAGTAHSCAISGGAVKCWGLNADGEIGNGAMPADSLTSAAVSGISLGTPVQVAAGADHSCALTSSGKVYCWGSNSNGQIGDGTTGTANDRGSATVVSSISGAIGIAAGGNHSCALLANGTVTCWGQNSSGELGNGGTLDSSSPVTVTGLSNVIQIAAGGSHTCALISGGTVKCWGSEIYGQLGNGTSGAGLHSSTPVAVSALSGVAELRLGTDHSCALLTTKAIYCWGRNTNGQLGNSTNTDSSTPVMVTGISDASEIAAGGAHSCAIVGTGSLECWGQNPDGQLGTGDNAEYWSPISSTSLTNATGIAAGGSHSCALLSDGTLRCWGLNGDGQLGNNSTTESWTEVTVQ